jgi:hypothetical protein
VTLSHAANAGSHPYADRGSELYETPRCAVEALLRVERLPHRIWEPAAGRGAIVRVLRDYGHEVTASDVINYGVGLDFVRDFFAESKAPTGCRAIISNPPYRFAAAFASHALDLMPRVYLLLRLAFMESVRRTELLEHRGLARIHVFRNRLPFLHRDNWTGPRASSAIAFAWYVWDRDHRGLPTINRISWSDQ